jgi:hypothetical protein
VNYINDSHVLYRPHNATDGRHIRDAMTDPEAWCILSLQKFPKELKKRLKMKALEREVDLQDLCVKYLEMGLAKDEPRASTAAYKK